MKKILITLFLIFTIIFSGCSKAPDCTKEDTTYEKFTYDEELKKCILSKKIEKDVCGNKVAEDDETYCNCPEDVKKTDSKNGCDGLLGEYLKKSCNPQKECVLTQNEKVIEQKKTFEIKNSDIIFEAEFEYKKPFIQNSDDKNKMSVLVTYFKNTALTKQVKDLTIKELRLENSASDLMAEISYNEKLGEIGSTLSKKVFTLNDIDKYQSSDSIKLKLIVSYTLETLDNKGTILKTEEKIETLTGSLGRVDIINPNFYEEPKK